MFQIQTFLYKKKGEEGKYLKKGNTEGVPPAYIYLVLDVTRKIRGNKLKAKSETGVPSIDYSRIPKIST